MLVQRVISTVKKMSLLHQFNQVASKAGGYLKFDDLKPGKYTVKRFSVFVFPLFKNSFRKSGSENHIGKITEAAAKQNTYDELIVFSLKCFLKKNFYY